ncbi:MAG: flagellar hook-associated protein 2 [Thermoleophilaceae bacterium]|nr:flagellar hook-associated protein 2 [Thermoleophilaceae bacterium]
MASSGISFGGLASGLDTNSIIDQLMAIERQPQDRLKLRQTTIDARKSALSDVATRLKNLRLAAQDLKSPTLWLDTQSIDVNDASKVAATRTGGAGTGAYQLTVTQLASSSQHWVDFPTAPLAADDTISFTYGPAGAPVTKAITIGAGSDITAAANTINSDAGSPVYASVVTLQDGTKQLAFSSKATGEASDFTVSDSDGQIAEVAAKWVPGQDAKGKVGTQDFQSSTNVVTSAIPGVQLTLKGTTGASPVTITVGAPGPDQAAVSAKVKAFVDQYNSTIDFIRSKVNEPPVVKPQTAADYTKGVLYGDSALNALLGNMRIALTDQYAENDGNPQSLDQLSELGISTGAAVGSGTLNQDSVAGKLTFDAAKFASAMATDQLSVRNLLGGNTSVADGFAKKFDDLLAPTVQAGGTLEASIASQDAQKKSISDQIARMDDLLKQKQEMLKQQFTAMEKALSQSQSQGQWLTGQINALGK